MSHRCQFCDRTFRKFDARLQHEAQKHPAEVEKRRLRDRERAGPPPAADLFSRLLALLELRRAA